METGDFVIWNSSGGKARGKITRIEDNGTINIPDSSFTVKGTKEDPAALIRVYQKQDDGWEASDTLVGHKLSTLTQIDSLPEPSAKRNQMFVDAIDMAVAILDQAKESYAMEEEYPMEGEDPAEGGIEEDELRATPSLVAPSFMQASAKRGLALLAEGESKVEPNGLKQATVNDARKMASGEALSEEKWRKISPWIARHIGDLDAVEGDEITAGLVAMLLWGGGSSKTSAKRTMDYAERIVKSLDPTETNKYDWRNMTDTMQWVATNVNEKRSIVYSNLELRAESDGNTIVGYAAIWDSPSEPMPFIEYVKRGAFSKTLNDGADVRLLVDHEGVPLARTKSGTLTLEEDDRGLRMEAKLDPSNPDAARMISAMRRGDLSQMSFAFRTVKDQWSSDRMTRELREVQLFDVSLVTFPAYEETVAELRTKREPVTVIPTSRLLLRKNQLAIQRIHSR
jgi:HK97 family phage prohead protease